MLRILLLICCYTLLIGLWGCRNILQPPTAPRFGPPTRAVVFVPGFKGSVLTRTSDDSVAWVTGWQALLGGGSLALESNATLGLPAGEQLHPTSVMQRIDLLFGLLSYDIYGETLSYLHERLPPEVELVELPYDWRKGALEGVRALSQTVETLHQRGIHDISIIAHSMGGLAAAYYLRFGDQSPTLPEESWAGAKRVSRAVLVAAPFRGSMAMFRDLQIGAPTFRNRSLLSNDVLAAYPSSYDLLPTLEEDAVVTRDGAVIVGLLRDVDSWSRYRWGALSSSLPGAAEHFEARRQQLATLLNRASEFSAALHSPPWLTDQQQLPIRLLVITGKGVPTLARASLDTNTGALDFSDEARLVQDGDGIVTLTSLRLPAGFRAIKTISEIQTDGEHLGALQSDRVRAAILNFILQP